MKRIITALGNSILNDELKKYSKYDVKSEDILYQEGLIDYLTQNEVDVIILSGLLQGQFSLVEFINEIRKLSVASRIIVITDIIQDTDKNILISKGVFDILKDEEVEIEDVIEAVDREEPINYKAEVQKKMDEINETSDSYNAKIISFPNVSADVQKQEVISVFGTNGSGKSTIAYNFVKALSKKTNSKILLIDFDTMNGNLDEFVGVSKVPTNIELIMDEDKKCGLNYAADLTLKNRFDTNVLDEIVISCNGFDFLSGNTSLHYCQNVLNTEFYNYLLKCAKEKYDFIFFDLSSNLFLDSTKWALQESTNVIFVTENTSICLKKSLQILDVVFNVWNVYKSKFKFLLNRTSSNNIDEDIFSEAIKMPCIGNIKQNQADNLELYGRALNILKFVPKKSLIEKVKSSSKVFSTLFANL